jgi:hypothetical protein
VPQLPRVAVLDPTLTGAVALRELVDGGLDVTGIGQPTEAALDVLRASALTRHWIAGSAATRAVPPRPWADVPEAGAGAALPAGDGLAGYHPVVTRAGNDAGPGQGFAVSLDGDALGCWDALVVTPQTAAVVAGVIATGGPWFGGVFHPRSAGVFVVGGEPGSASQHPLVELRARWVGEYLRGRYQLPAYQAMLDRPELRHRGLRGRGPRGRTGRGLVRALERELRAGRSRAAAAGYPLPLPAAAQPRALG